MATLACCGETVDFSGDAVFANVGAHSLSIQITSNEQEVPVFRGESGGFVDFLACNKAGSVSVTTYNAPDLDVQDTGTLSVEVCGETLSYPYVCIGTEVSADASSTVNFTTNLRITNS
jgi:hypothetical protein